LSKKSLPGKCSRTHCPKRQMTNSIDRTSNGPVN